MRLRKTVLLGGLVLATAGAAALSAAPARPSAAPHAVADIQSVCPRADVLDSASRLTAQALARTRAFLQEKATTAPEEPQIVTVSFVQPRTLTTFLTDADFPLVSGVAIELPFVDGTSLYSRSNLGTGSQRLGMLDYHRQRLARDIAEKLAEPGTSDSDRAALERAQDQLAQGTFRVVGAEWRGTYAQLLSHVENTVGGVYAVSFQRNVPAPIPENDEVRAQYADACSG